MDEMFNWCCLGDIANGDKIIKAYSISQMARILVAAKGYSTKEALGIIALTFHLRPVLISESTEYVIVDDTAREWPDGLPE